MGSGARMEWKERNDGERRKASLGAGLVAAPTLHTEKEAGKKKKKTTHAVEREERKKEPALLLLSSPTQPFLH